MFTCRQAQREAPWCDSVVSAAPSLAAAESRLTSTTATSSRVSAEAVSALTKTILPRGNRASEMRLWPVLRRVATSEAFTETVGEQPRLSSSRATNICSTSDVAYDRRLPLPGLVLGTPRLRRCRRRAAKAGRSEAGIPTAFARALSTTAYEKEVGKAIPILILDSRV